MYGLAMSPRRVARMRPMTSGHGFATTLEEAHKLSNTEFIETELPENFNSEVIERVCFELGLK